jgi:phosphoglucomutase
MFEITYG